MKLKVLIIVLVLFPCYAFGFNTNHPYLYFTQTDLNNLQYHIKESGASDYITSVYSKMKTYADSTITDSPIGDGLGSDLVNYEKGLTDTEKATAWAICAHVEQTGNYAQKATDFVNHYIDIYPVGSLYHWWGWEMNIMIIYDLTVGFGLYTAQEITDFQNKMASRYSSTIAWAETDPSWQQNMSHWETGVACLTALMGDNSTEITRAYAQFTRRIDATTAAGAFLDYTLRGDDGLGYNVFSLNPLVIAAQAAENTGRTWFTYESSGRSLENCFDFLADPTTTKPGSSWIPTIYGNLSDSAHSETSGDYSDPLAQKILSDQRHVFEVAQKHIPKQAYLDILTDESGGKNARDDIFDYHTHYWLATFLNVSSVNNFPVSIGGNSIGCSIE